MNRDNYNCAYECADICNKCEYKSNCHFLGNDACMNRDWQVDNRIGKKYYYNNIKLMDSATAYLELMKKNTKLQSDFDEYKEINDNTAELNERLSKEIDRLNAEIERLKANRKISHDLIIWLKYIGKYEIRAIELLKILQDKNDL